MNISFDFDSTLSEEIIQRLLSLFNRDNCNIFIITSRNPGLHNTDLFRVAKELQICSENLYFTDGMPKSQLCQKLNIDIHFDDMPEEIAHIQATCNTLGLLVSRNIFGDMNYLLTNFEPFKSIQCKD